MHDFSGAITKSCTVHLVSAGNLSVMWDQLHGSPVDLETAADLFLQADPSPVQLTPSLLYGVSGDLETNHVVDSE